jgi:hypothetical protein
MDPGAYDICERHARLLQQRIGSLEHRACLFISVRASAINAANMAADLIPDLELPIDAVTVHSMRCAKPMLDQRPRVLISESPIADWRILVALTVCSTNCEN